jgi:IS1 family transposase
MCITGLKKTASPESSCHILELDELYWFIERKAKSETRENVYIMTAVSRNPRQIVGFDAASDKTSLRIQNIVDNAPPAEKYYSDGYVGYLDVVYPGEHIQNIRDKSETYTVEGVNADLRHYIPILARRSRCFARSIETLRAVVDVFVDAYNQFGLAKHKYRQTRKTRYVPFSVLDFL